MPLYLLVPDKLTPCSVHKLPPQPSYLRVIYCSHSLVQSTTFQTKDSIYLLSNLYGNLLDIWEWWVEPEEDLSGYITMILTTKSGVEPHWTWTHEILPCLLFTCRLQDLLRTPYLPELPPQRGKLRPKCDGSLGVESDQQSQNCQFKSSQHCIPDNCHWRHWRRQCKFFWPV